MIRRGMGYGRSSLHPNKRERVSEDSRGEVFTHAKFFVPSFSVRRQLFPNKEALDFEKRLAEYCEKRPYVSRDIRRMGITILEKGRFVDMYHRANVQPEADKILELALNVRGALNSAVRSKPHLLDVPLGGVAVFGKRSNKIAATLEGWKGFDKAYASRDESGKVLANRQLVREINGSVGEIVQFVGGGIDGDGDYVDISTRAIQRQSPHFTFAEKPTGTIGNNERVDIAGQVMEFMPEELAFYDPVMHLSLVTPGSQQTAYTNDMGEVSVETGGLYVRRTKFRSFGGTTLQLCITGDDARIA